ncbi:MAG: hypothetical protein ACI87E_003203 [Mariniblastus sp.]|jgi:hypothetical protein
MPFRSFQFSLSFLLGCLGVCVSLSADDERVDYASQVQPILSAKCWNCHGPDANTREADLRLDLRSAALHVLETNSDESAELVSRIKTDDADLQMPPSSTKKPLTNGEIDILQSWIEQGAEYESHWSFKPPTRQTIPNVSISKQFSNEIDAFIREKLATSELSPAPTADRETLIRRLSLDVTGLPPTPAEIRSFLDDQSTSAYEDLVDRLLASPRYGEHMAVPWLDAARYADTDGYQNDRYRYMHVWRDWVILALNDNKPYDEFLVEQIAGDMLPNATLKQQIATGFCRNHRINSEDGSIPNEWHVENVVDRVDTLSTAVMGLTIGCARCHDHKFDPISAKEYYQLFAYFNNVPEWGVGPNNGNSPPFIDVPKSWPNLTAEENVARVPDPVKLRRSREKDDGNGLKRPQAGNKNTVMVMHEMESPRDTFLLVRGQFDEPDQTEKLSPGVPDSLAGFSTTTPTNRLELARWLVEPQHPLTARVAVNRMWQHFFGIGLVKTSENFGLQGELPSHPRLLDWLAVEFVENDWDVKAIQKRILMSATYRQSSSVSELHRAIDPSNRLLARGPRIRLHPFSLRDSMLASSGLLVEKLGGEPTMPYMPPKIWRSISNNKYVQDKGDQLYRRSVYTFWRRTIPPPTMVNFNAAEREVCLVRKDRTNTPLQALTQMNNVTFVESARFLGERMMNHSKDDQAAIEFGFQLLMARKPSVLEIPLLVKACATFKTQFQLTPESAEQLLSVGEKPRDKKLNVVRHASLTMTASLMMNLDEAITKE